jgi:uncharacterized ion transporter superfamily protein YfcC
MTAPTDRPASRLPDTLLILLTAGILAWLATFLVPKGFFGGEEGAFTLADFSLAGRAPAPFFGDGETTGLLDFLFDGLVSGDAYGATVGLMAFLLCVGGAFGIVSRTRALERALIGLLARHEQGATTIIPVLFVIFSLAGAVFGMGEEAIVFVVVLTPAMRRAGFDALTSVLTIYAATQIGFATSWMNPFSVAVAQGIAGLPVMSGWQLRMAMWLTFTAAGAFFAWRYARSIRKPPADLAADETGMEGALRFGHWLVIATVLLGIVWIAWGVGARQYYFPEISTQFFAIGLVAGIIGTVFRLEGMTANGAAEAFASGAKDLVPAVLIIGAAKGVVLLLGGDDPNSPSVLNTWLHAMGGATSDLPPTLSALGMLGLQSLINLVVVSGSGQAALTMPLMAPLADLNGVSRQIAVLAFQLGDGLTNIICPASAALMGSLAAARVSWGAWFAFAIRPVLASLLLGAAFVVLAVSIGYS